MKTIIDFLIRNKKIVIQVLFTAGQYLYKNRKIIKEKVTNLFKKRTFDKS